MEARPGTVVAALEAAAREFGPRPALHHRRGGEWRSVTWTEYRDRALTVGRGLAALGLEPGRGVAILSANRPEWFFAAVGTIAAGGIPAGLYTTSAPEQWLHVVGHAGATVAIVENRAFLERFSALRERLPELRRVVLIEGAGGDAAGEGVVAWDELLARGREAPARELERRVAAQAPEDLATLIYTSGTTGPPKGVMLSHRNLTWTAAAVAEAFDERPDDAILCYLPLGHVAEQMVSVHAPMVRGAGVWFAESLDKLAESLRDVRPTVFFSVPRVWEKMQAAIQEAGRKAPGWKRRLGAWARGVGLAAGRAEQRGGRRPLLHPLAERLVFRAVRARIGLDRARLCLSGAAPISTDTLEFFLSLGIPILEIYGQSECSGPATFSLPGRYRTGRVGTPMPGTEIRIAEDGEILVRGPHVFMGYRGDREGTGETVDADGWLHTGDVGRIDEDGFLAVTDRKKELIITSGGKNVGPQVIEVELQRIPAVERAVVVGDGRRYLTALLTLDPERVAAVAEGAGSDARDVAAAAACPRFLAALERQVAEVNSRLARFETIKRFSVLPEALTVEAGELTPTLKLKRRVIAKRYAERIEALYRGDEPGGVPVGAPSG